MKPKNKTIKEPVPSNIQAFTSIRRVMFVEASPNSNEYYQIIFTPEQYEFMSRAMTHLFPIDKGLACNHQSDGVVCTCCNLIVSKERFTLPELREVVNHNVSKKIS